MSFFPAISVIVVNWNGLHHLRECLPSLLAQDYPKDRLEWIVVDNGSVDGSVEFLAREFPSVRVLRNQKNEGFAKPNNDAARAARGEYIALINNDMRADPRWLVEAVKRLDESQGRVCVGSGILSWDGKKVDFNGGTLQFLGYAVQQDIGESTSEVIGTDKDILFACGGAMLVRRDVFLSTGGFDDDYFAIFEDVDFGWRLWLMGYRVGLAPRSVVFHRLHGTLDKSREEKMRYLMHRNALRTIIKNYEEETLRRVLPIAVIQALRRAIYFSGVDRSSFYLWARQDQAMGPEEVPPDAIVRQCRDAMNHLVMLDDIFESIPQLRKKRARVQGRRQVADERILKLFGDPFRTIVQDAAYERVESDLIRHFNLGGVFTTRAGHPAIAPDSSDRTGDEKALLRDEIRRLEKQNRQLELQLMQLQAEGLVNRVAASQPARVMRRKGIPELFHEFLRIWRHQGLQPALRQTYRFYKTK